MPETADVAGPVCRLSPSDGGQYFFGYYDIPAADTAGRHLCHQVAFRDRFPTPTDKAALGWLDLSANEESVGVAPFATGPADCPAEFHPFASTLAWSFQQGSMLQWLPAADTCLYNTFTDGHFGCCVHNVVSDAQRHLPLPVANVARDGSKALCVNMPRIFDFRPGYGYEELPDPRAGVPAPADDGVFLMDLATGDHRLLLSLAEMVDFLAADGEEIAGKKVVVNHLTFNPSGSRYLLLLRSMDRWPWMTWLLTADASGGGLRHHNAHGVASHYHWRDDREMLFYMRPAPEARLELLTVDDETDERVLIDTSYFLSDGHCSYSPDGKWLLYDSYPDSSTPDRFRSLYLYSLEQKRGFTLGRFRSEIHTPETVDLRCDLHPRWMPDGRSVTFDSIHEGFRGLYLLRLDGNLG